MVRILIHGCNGQMGKVVAALAAQDETVEAAAGVDIMDDGKNEFPVFKRVCECNVPVDVVVDFSSAKAVDFLLEDCVAGKLPLVLCSTGLDEGQLAAVEEASKVIPVLRSANMSLGINTLLKLVKEAAQILAGAGFDMEIVERHHNRKLDAPSGTALALADSLNEGVKEPYHYTYDRSGRRQKRDPKEIGISAVRGGSIVGDHEVIFAGTDEVVEFSHHAYSRNVFAKGALEAAKFLAACRPGKYDMSDVIG